MFVFGINLVSLLLDIDVAIPDEHRIFNIYS